MTRILFTIAAAFLPFSLTTAADEKPTPLDEATFVNLAGQGGMLEVQLGKVASGQAKRQEVKSFAELMVADHGKAAASLKEAAKAAGVAMPHKLDEKHAETLAKFKTYKGTNFDKDYISDMITDHTNDLVLFTRAAKELKNKDLRDFAAGMIPIVRGHLDQAKKINR